MVTAHAVRRVALKAIRVPIVRRSADGSGGTLSTIIKGRQCDCPLDVMCAVELCSDWGSSAYRCEAVADAHTRTGTKRQIRVARNPVLPARSEPVWIELLGVGKESWIALKGPGADDDQTAFWYLIPSDNEIFDRLSRELWGRRIPSC
jgi:hypothetical protein